jgi:hypothetical protein
MSKTVNRTLPVIVSSQSPESNDFETMSWIYAHGELEKRMGWDCLAGSVTQTGIWPCVFRDDDGEESCIAFIWNEKYTANRRKFGNRRVGLVCLSGDVHGIDHAMRKMQDLCGV